MNESVKFRHELGELTFRPATKVAASRLKTALRNALDDFVDEGRVAASVIQNESRRRNGARYGTPGFYVSLYRYRAGMTQAHLAGKSGLLQHHVSEIERNRRPVGKVLARRLASILKFDYRKLL